MIGLLWPVPGRVRVSRERYLGLPVLRATVPNCRRLGRACRLLARQGVRRVLLHRQLEGLPLSHGLVPLDPGPLYRHLAPSLALAALEAGGHRPCRSVVVLRGEGLSGDLCRAADRLCPRVAQVRVEAGEGSSRVQYRLLTTYGMAADPNVPATLTLRLDGPDGGEELYLADGGARMGPLSLGWPWNEGPEEVEKDPVLCAFWQAGVLFAEKIPINLLDNRGQ